ncbi:MAG: PIN domain-containing protein [Propionibacteriaceae bacterium]|nr:PIN domain-containing protein [Propionibacteriaceae bacterium]
MIVDTSVLYSWANTAEPSHEAASQLLNGSDEALVVTPYVLAELDYFLLTRLGVRHEVATIRALLGPAWEIAKIGQAQLAVALDIVEQYADSKIGLADAANIVVAQAYGTRQIATLDHRHYAALRFPDGSPVEILP